MERALISSHDSFGSEAFKKIEGKLRSIFKPVQPRTNFIHKLEDQLLTKPAIYIEKKSKSAAWILLTIGLFGGVVIVWLVKKLTKHVKRAE